jgi:hypothetical protein
MKRILTGFALFLVIFSSGCTVPILGIEIPFLPDIFGGMTVNEQRHDVISIERLEAIPSTTVRSGQSIRLRAIVKNLQKPEYAAIDNITVQLYNYCGMFKVTGEFCSGTTAPQDNDHDGIYECSLRMHPQSTALVEWKLEANDINVETPCKIGVLAKYNYTTYSTTSVTFVNKAEYSRLVSEGKSFSETGVASIGEGPVKPYIEVLNQPIVIDASQSFALQNAGSGIMSFWVENKGGGILELDEAGAQGGNLLFDCRNPASMKMCLGIGSTSGVAGGTENIKVLKSDSNDTITIEKCIETHLKGAREKPSITFIGRSTPKYSCSITVADPSRVKQESTYHIEADISYWYKFTKELTLTVQPRIKL